MKIIILLNVGQEIFQQIIIRHAAYLKITNNLNQFINYTHEDLKRRFPILNLKDV
jgi:hypothetical protein